MICSPPIPLWLFPYTITFFTFSTSKSSQDMKMIFSISSENIFDQINLLIFFYNKKNSSKLVKSSESVKNHEKTTFVKKIIYQLFIENFYIIFLYLVGSNPLPIPTPVFMGDLPSGPKEFGYETQANWFPVIID